jgi:threonine dehydrogenase-like Zn-dependent dehydrogenase
MKAVAVKPGQKYSAHLVDIDEPQVGPHQVLVEVEAVGIDGTDREINQGGYGNPPKGDDVLVMGHESYTRVVSVGDGVRRFKPGDHVTATVRRPGGCVNCRHGAYDMCLDGDYTERGINGRHGYMTERYVDGEEFFVHVPDSLKDVGMLVEPVSVAVKGVEQAWAIQNRMWWQPHAAGILGAGQIGLFCAFLLRARGLEVYVMSQEAPDSLEAQLVGRVGAHYVDTKKRSIQDVGQSAGGFDVVFEATGYSPLIFDALQQLHTNGVMCLFSVTDGKRDLEINSDQFNNEMVFGNRLVFGSVNSNHGHFERAVTSMEQFSLRWPGLLDSVITEKVHGIDNFAQAIATDQKAAEARRMAKSQIKSVLYLD